MDKNNRTLATPLNIKPTSLAAERAAALYRGIPLSIGVTLILTMLLTLSHWNVVDGGDLIFWNILILFSMTLRIITWFFWRNSETNLNAANWLILFRGGVLLAGLIWGSSAYFMFADKSTPYQALLAFTLAGVASGSLTSLAIDKFSAVSFVTLAIVPFSIRLHAEQGQIAMSMSVMTALFIFFVLSATSRARAQLESSHAQNARLIEWGNERLEQQQMGKILNDAQTHFIANEAHSDTFEQLLNDIVNISNSKFGFIGEIIYNESNIPSLSMLAMSNIIENTETHKSFDNHKIQAIQPNNLNNLAGMVINTGKHIISNNPAADMRAGGATKGQLTLTAFIGIPIFHKTRQVAMLGLANNDRGYEEVQLEQLRPATHLIAQFMIAIEHRRQHIADKENIQRQAQHTQAILDGVFDGIITINELGTITSFNQAAEIIFGYTSQQIMGSSLLRLIPTHKPSSDISENLIKNLNDTLGIGQELIGLRKNGKTFEMELALSTVADEGEKTYVGVIRDISDRKHTDKLKNEFISTVSHELRTPLTSIAASLAIIESGNVGTLPEKAHNLIQIAKQNSLRLQRLIDDLLDMDKLLSNKIEFAYTDFDMVSAVEKTLVDNQYIANKYQIKFQIISAERNCQVTADNIRVQQVLTHILSNAAKFSKPHTTVDISIAKHKNTIKVLIIDHGAGIATELKDNIFNSFTQADSSSTRQKDGIGIGLTISKELIEKMGGLIGFTSQLGQGSCFYFELPRAKHSLDQ